eukprot:1156958-Pelagomonas_calceolata.AAC.2
MQNAEQSNHCYAYACIMLSDLHHNAQHSLHVRHQRLHLQRDARLPPSHLSTDAHSGGGPVLTLRSALASAHV